ncbi:MAG: S9 family peptidase [Acidobacteria bacterium]|nr:S9 family peptidase [Acidobacteriota bacterium]
MKKIKLLFVMLFVFSSLVRAQEKLLTIDDIFDSQKRVSFNGKPTTSVRWLIDGTSYSQTQPGEGGSLGLYRVDAKTGKTTLFHDASKIETALAAAGLKAEDAKKLAVQPSFEFNKAQTATLLNSDNDLYFYDFSGGAAKRLTNNAGEEKEADFSPDGRMVSFVRGNNLFVVEIASGKETQLTKDGAEKFLNGVLDWVYEEELYGRGNKRGYWWSPDSAKIAFLRTDETPVKNFVVVNHQGVYQTVENTPYPKAGSPNPTVKLGIADLKDGAIKFVETAKYKPEDFLIVRVAWTPDNCTVIYQAQNREQTFLDVNTANCETGASVTVFTEKSPAWVEVIDNPAFLKNGTAIWQSARSGYKHLYLYDNTGNLVRQITSGDWEVRDLYGVDEKNNFAYFSATASSAIAPQIYRVKLDGTGLKRISTGDGSHAASFNETFTHFVDTYSEPLTPAQTRLYRADGTLERVINENRVEVLSQYKLSKPEFLKVKTRDNFELEAMMIKPPNFDQSKKYPVMSFVYSGPHAPQVRNAWGSTTGMWYQMLAQNGYIIWVIDNRTASGKGTKSEYGLYKNFGETELKDLEEGVSYLKSLPFVDGSRIGISGWSFGGYMTAYALTHSKNFKIGIAGGTVSDWSLYDSIYTERYMGTPQTNPEGYKKSSVLTAAKDLSGKLLLVHGAIDDNVHLQNTMQLVYELQRAGKQFDLMLYPTARHGVTNPLQVKHMRQMMTDFILKNL